MNEKQVAIVTGASRGIGKAIAVKLAGLDFDIIFSFLSNDEAAEKTRAEITGKGVNCLPVKADIADSEDREKLVSKAGKEFGRCDLLVNNAGIPPSKRADILEASEESFEKVINVNLKGPYFLTQSIANWMIKQKQENPDRKFRICNIGSLSAYASSPSRGEYCVSKAGVGMMTKLYADRLAEYGINVLEIRPGIIMTDMTSVVKDKYDKLISEGLTPIRRWGQPEDIAAAVSAVAEGKLDFCTGNAIDVDGGFHLKRL